ncbi:MAG TPA: septal ring lytic transglycosylase RlpA family protein [Steroidobacteraceae bacterium]|nr:septal ring lytic transglycosylase RlpA family protein [Steroidobacteraceae bacterium]
MRSRRLYGGLSLLLLAGCFSPPARRTPPAPTPAPTAPSTVLPSNPPSVNDIPDAIPRFEPRSVYGNPPFYVVAGHRYAVLPSSAGYVERGVASWYGTEFHGLKTSTGESYDMFAMTAAHKTLPLPCYARVTNLSNGRSAVVRINDRGPFVANRIIDLSYSAARKLDMIRNGTAFVQLEVLTPAAPMVTAELPVSVPAISASVIGASTAPPIPGPPPAVPPPAALPSSTFFIQVGAYAKSQNAQSVARRLRASGIDRVITLAPTDAQPLQRVRIGPIVSVQQFDALISQLATLGYPNARLAQD